MIVHFSKYHGTGNDFVMLDGREQDTARLSTEAIHRLCDRRFGIGGDGLIILEESERADFKMRYFNADGHEGSMCGNGGRCITAFAFQLGLFSAEASFEGIDGLHSATLLPDGNIRLKLIDVHGLTSLEDGYLLDTGSPHFVKFVRGLEKLDVAYEGREIRHQDRFAPGGVNVNFVETGSSPEQISVRTFERGVEAETYSCGTGVTAAAICSYFHRKTDKISYDIQTLGGKLNVSFSVNRSAVGGELGEAKNNSDFTDVYLSGPAVQVYMGSIELNP
jgi:diaminopimelate epimerase